MDNRDIFKKAFNWSDYQDTQLDTLKKISESYTSSLNISKDIETSLGKIKGCIDSMSPRSGTTGGSSRILLANSSGTEVGEKFVKSMKTLLEEEASTRRKELEDREKLQRKKEKVQEEFLNNVTTLITKASAFASKLGSYANKFSEVSNNLISYSGANESIIREFRDTIVHDMTPALNSVTGNYFNSQKVYEQVTSIAKDAGIGNLDTLKEVARPLMLASESMDVNLTSMAGLLGRWQVRYNFSSSAMEEIVNDIRGSTANNQATAQATMENIEKLATRITVYANGDTEKIKDYTKNLSETTAWLESNGIDSSKIVEIFSDIADGDAFLSSEIQSILQAGGSDAFTAQKQFSEGNYMSIADSIWKGYNRIIEEVGVGDLGKVSSEAARVLGTDDELLWNLAALKLGNATDMQEFIDSMDTRTAAEAIEDKYVSMSDKISNNVQSIYEILADGQEKFGIGLSDVAGAYVLIQGIGSGIGTIAKVFPRVKTVLDSMLVALGGAASAAPAAGGIVAGGAAAAGATAIGVSAGVAAGVLAVAGIAGSIYDAVSEGKESEKELLNTLIGATREIKENKVALMEEIISVDDKGNIVYSYATKMVSPEEYDPKKNLENLTKAKEQDLDKYDMSVGNALWNDDVDWWKNVISLVTGMGNDWDGDWYDYIPGLGKGLQQLNHLIGTVNTNSEYEFREEYLNFLNGLNAKEKVIASAYASSGLMADKSQFETMMDSWGTLVHLWDNGYMLSLDDDKDKVERSVLGYETGSNYIPSNQIAYLHEGEAIVPKKYNPMANLTELEALREKVNNSSNEESKEFLRTLNEIKEFLSYWREDNIVRETTNRNRNKFSTANAFTDTYAGSD